MNIALGHLRATALRELAEGHPNQLKRTPCPLMGSNEVPMRIWCWSTHVVVTSNDDSRGHKINMDAWATDADLVTFEGGVSASTSSTPDITYEENGVRKTAILAKKKCG